MQLDVTFFLKTTVSLGTMDLTLQVFTFVSFHVAMFPFCLIVYIIIIIIFIKDSLASYVTSLNYRAF